MSTPVQQAAIQAKIEGRRLRAPAPYRPSRAPERMAERRLKAQVRRLYAGYLERVLEYVGTRTDSDFQNVRRLLRPLTDAFRGAGERDVKPIVDEAERQQRAAEGRSMRPLGIDVLGSEPWLRAELARRSRQFASLIKDIGTDAEVRASRIASEALEKGWDRRRTRKEMGKALGISSRRAALVGRDQTRKLQGALHKARQKDVGISSYIWRDSRDERVAGNPAGRYPKAKSNDRAHGDHWERNGRRFLWEKQGDRLVEVLKDGSTRVTEYVDGHPGEPINDRCFAEPYIDELADLQDLDSVAPVAASPLAVARRQAPRLRRRRAPTTPTAPPPPQFETRAAMFREKPAREWTQLHDLPEESEQAWPLLQQDWVHGSKRKGAVALKQAVLSEFAFARGVPFSRRAWRVSEPMKRRAQAATRLEYERTQDALRRRHPGGFVTLYRGVKTGYDVMGALESWTDKRSVAADFAGPDGAVMQMEVPIEHVLTWHGAKTWQDGVYGAQSEWVVIGGYD